MLFMLILLVVQKGRLVQLGLEIEIDATKVFCRS